MQTNDEVEKGKETLDKKRLSFLKEKERDRQGVC